MEDMKHLEYLQTIADEDVKELKRKEETYKGSWKKRGGAGAFHMLARKWDRLENMAEEDNYDIFSTIERHFSNTPEVGADGTALAEIRDLRRYLMLIESEIATRGKLNYRLPLSTFKLEVSAPGTPENGGHHELAQFDDKEPWIIRKKRAEKLLPLTAINVLYRDYHAHYLILNETITCEDRIMLAQTGDKMAFRNGGRALLRSAVNAYVRVSDARDSCYVLKVSDAPEEDRDFWPELRRELNLVEHGQLLTWQRMLYRFDDDNSKWVLQDTSWSAE